MELHNLIVHYGSDKNKSGYTPTYVKIFEEYKNKDINILEIGIGTLLPGIPSSFLHTTRSIKSDSYYKPGGSLRVWRDYFPKAWIYGGDIADDCMFEEERITTLQFDSTKSIECNRLLRGLDFTIIIDDGLHTIEAQWSTLQNTWNNLKKGGLYIIEDIRYPDTFKDRLDAKIRNLVNKSDISFNVKGNLMFIKKY